VDIDPSARFVHGGDLTWRIIGLAMRVHRRLGPGLLESAYEACLRHELKRITCRSSARFPVKYSEVDLDSAYVADIIVAEQVNLQIQSGETSLPLHQAQRLTYLR
jgi:GxxExxY protein